MNIFENLSQLSKRGLLDVPTPEPKYQIVQFPEEFVKIEDTERVFGISPTAKEEQASKRKRDIVYINTGQTYDNSSSQRFLKI